MKIYREDDNSTLCRYCGEANEPLNRFCVNCGNLLKKEENHIQKGYTLFLEL